MRYEIVHPDSLRMLSGQMARMQQQVQNLHRRLGAYRCELDVGDSPLKPFCRFTLNAALATSDASVAATITDQYGPGADHTTTTITVYNFLTHDAGVYQYEGDSGDAGKAYWDSGTSWHVFDMECP